MGSMTLLYLVVRAFVHTLGMFFSSKTTHNQSTPGSNLTYLASSRIIFHGCQIIYLDTRKAKNFILKDKLICIMKKMYGFHGNR